MAEAILYCTATAALLALAARAAEEAVAAYGGPRRWAWVVALGLSVLLPVAALLAEGPLPFGIPGLRSDSVDLGALLALAVPARADAVAPDANGGLATAALDVLLLGAWLMASAIVLCSYATAWRAVHRAARRWRVTRVGDTDVLVSRGVGPVVLGLRRPRVVLPEWLLAEPPAALRVALTHEREHVRARDHWLLAAAPLIAIAAPWNLPLWWQLRRLRLAVELDCDRRVLAHGVAPALYGNMLLDVAARSRSPVLAAAALAEPRSFLERRILAMTRRTPARRLPRAFAFSAAAAVLAAFACETAGPMNVNDVEPQPAVADATAEAAADDAAVYEYERQPAEFGRAKILSTESVSDGGSLAEGRQAGELRRRATLEEQAARALRPKVRSEQSRGELRRSIEEAVLTEVEARYRAVEERSAAEARYGELTAEESAALPLRRRSAKAQPSVAGMLRIRASQSGSGLTSPILFIDGREASLEELNGLARERIESIEVLKGPAALRVMPGATEGIIYVWTRDPR